MSEADDPLDFGDGAGGAALRLLDGAARCSICYAFHDAPLALRTCGHSFCSGCIRHNLAFQERGGQPTCPACRKPCDSRDLHVNVTLRDVVDRYAAVRPLLLQLVQQAEELAAAKQQLAELQRQWGQQQQQAGGRQLRSASRKRAPEGQVQVEQGGRKTARTAANSGAEHSTRRQTRSAAQQQQQQRGSAVSSGGSQKGQGASQQSEDSWDSAAPGDSSSSGGGDSAVSAESLSPPTKRQRRGQRGRQAKVEGGGEEQPQQRQQQGQQTMPPTPDGRVRCPICRQTVPEFAINFHVDKCLTHGGGGSVEPPAASDADAPGPSRLHPQPALARQQQQAQEQKDPPQRQQQQEHKQWEALAVPPKIVPNLATDKALRGMLKKCGLPTEGKKKASHWGGCSTADDRLGLRAVAHSLSVECTLVYVHRRGAATS